MTLLLRRRHAQAHIGGTNASIWSDEFIRSSDEIGVGRIHRSKIHGDCKWLWFLQTDPAPPPNHGIADTLEEAKAAFKQRYAEAKGKWESPLSVQ